MVRISFSITFLFCANLRPILSNPAFLKLRGTWRCGFEWGCSQYRHGVEGILLPVANLLCHFGRRDLTYICGTVLLPPRLRLRHDLSDGRLSGYLRLPVIGLSS